MALNEFAGVSTTAGALVRFDTDPNSVSPADVRLSPWGTSAISGSVVQAGGDGSVPTVYSPSATLYQKTVARSAPWKTLSSATLTGVSTDAAADKTDESAKWQPLITSGPTTARPSAVTVGVGAWFYDTDLGVPIWSDGASWHSATGADV